MYPITSLFPPFGAFSRTAGLANRFHFRNPLGIILFATAAAFSAEIEGRTERLTIDYDAPTSTSSVNGTVTLRILLVEFTDITCRKGQDGVTPRYTGRDFENLLGSSGIYVSPGMRSPDGDEVFGSLNDYYQLMSTGRLSILASVINRMDTVTGRPIWLKLWKGKSAYQTDNMDVLWKDGLRAAQMVCLDVTTSEETKLVIIYAGNTYYRGGGLTPRADSSCYIMSELQGRPYDQENEDAKFARVGLHCHEFGHLIGIGHSSGSRADLMQAGSKNGSVEGNAPAPLNPIARMKKGWIDPISISGTTPVTLPLHSSMSDPMVVMMTNSTGDYFLVENRRFDQCMSIGAATVPDYNNAAYFPPAWPHNAITQGIFVWRVLSTKGDPAAIGYSTEGLLYASGRYGRTYPENIPSETDDGVPFPGVSGKMLLTPWSDPRSPCEREQDSFGSGSSHYTVYVPSTKRGSSCGMEILSEDRARGVFWVRFYPSQPPNPGLDSLEGMDSLRAYSGRRTLCYAGAGLRLQVVEFGGEIFLRREWSSTGQQRDTVLSDCDGGNSVPGITVAGSATLVVWQRRTSCEEVYDIVSRRSSDLGKSWTPPGVLLTLLATGGPLPTIAGSKDGPALVLFRSSLSNTFQLLSPDGLSWGPPAPGPDGVACLAASTLSVETTRDGLNEAVLTYSIDNAQTSRCIWSSRYSFLTGLWGHARCESAELPSQFSNYSNPNLSLIPAMDSATLHVIWDATDRYMQGRHVILSRGSSPGTMRSVYRMLRGRWQDEITVSDLPEKLSGVQCAGCARALTLTNTEGSASMTIEVGGMRLLRADGSVDTLDFDPLPADSETLDVPRLMKGGRSVPFRLPPGVERIQVLVSVYGEDPASFVSANNSCVGFDLVSSRCDSMVARLGEIPPSLMGWGVRKSILLTFPFPDISGLSEGECISIRPFVHGILEGPRVTALLGQVYLADKEVPAETLSTNARDASTRVYVPQVLELYQNYPNPFNPLTVIKYTIAGARGQGLGVCGVSLVVYDLLGRKVAVLANEKKAPGRYEVTFDARGLASGVYIYRLKANSFVQSRKMLLLK